MQTFLPYEDFELSAITLDNRRLGKQRVETLQILKSLTDPSYGWKHHPAVVMWRGYEYWLKRYGLAICDAWIDRGYKDTCKEKISKFNFPQVEKPWWIGYTKFHDSHKSNLLRKDPSYYTKYNWQISDNLPYVWPVRN